MSSTTDETGNRREITRLLERINDAWLHGRPEDLPAALGDCFAPEMVVRGPDLGLLGKGKEACIRSYQDFLSQATVRECRLSPPEIDLAGDTAVAGYAWDMVYVLAGSEHHESGRDLFVLARTGDGWRAVWRTLLVTPPAAEPSEEVRQ
jgi:ketosteroid isomerase-like protein